MTALLYLAGLIIGAALFFYLLSLYHEGKERVKQMSVSTRKSVISQTSSRVEAEKVSYPHLKSIPPGERICPLCRTPLTRYEPLYASQVDTGSGSRILIHGCTYCYKENGSSD